MESRRPHIAIVENDDAFGAALVRLLKAGGFETVLFPSAEQFLENAHLDDLACVVLDVHLPGASGFELLSRLRRDLLKIPVLLMTADDSPATRRRALGSECMDFLIKPFEATALLGTLRRCVLPPAPMPNQGL